MTTSGEMSPDFLKNANEPGELTDDTIMGPPMPKKKRAPASPSPWMKHVAAYRAQHECTYKEALKLAKNSYTKAPRRLKKDKADYKPNRWMEHIKDYTTTNPSWKQEMTYKKLLIKLKETYKKI